MANVESELQIRINDQHLNRVRQTMDRIAADAAAAQRSAANTGTAYTKSFKDSRREADEFWRTVERGKQRAAPTGLTSPVAPSGMGQRFERMLGMDPTVVLGESRSDKARLGQILQRRERFQSMLGGQMGQIGGLGMLAMGGHQAMGMVRGYEQATVGRERGMYSGDLTQAMGGQVAYSRGMQRVGASGIGTAGALIGGKMALGGGPWGMAGGAAVFAGAQLIQALTEGYIGRGEAREQAATSTLGRFMGRRTALAQSQLPITALGGESIADEVMREQAGRYGINVSQQQAMRTAFARAGGGAARGLSEETLYQAERGLNLDAGQIGGMFRGQAPGGGARSGVAGERLLSGVIANAFEAGIRRERLGELLGQIASTNERMAARGVTIDMEGQERVARGLTAAGFQGFQGRTVMDRTRGLGQGLLGSLQEMIMPQAARQGLLLQEAFRGGRGIGGALKFAGDIERTGDPDVLRRIYSQFAPEQAMAGLGADLGMTPDTAARLLRYGGAAGDFAAPGADGLLPRAAAAVMGTPEGDVAAQTATIDAMTVFAEGLGKLNEHLNAASALMAMNVENMRALAGSIETSAMLSIMPTPAATPGRAGLDAMGTARFTGGTR